jgi:hypothetical protein
MREILRQVKIMVKQSGVEAEERIRSLYSLSKKEASGAGASGPSGAGAGAGAGGSGSGAHSGGVGSIDEAVSGLGLGLAPPSARPSAVQLPASIAMRTGALSPASPRATFRSGSPTPSSPVRTFAGPGIPGRAEIALDLNGAWRQFKSTPGLGAETASEISSLKARINEKKAEAAASVKAANIAKDKIDALVKELADIRSGVRPSTAQTTGSAVSGPAGGDKGGRPQSSGSKKTTGSKAGAETVPAAPPPPTPEEEEARVAGELAEAKRAYRAAYDRLNAAKQHAAALGAEVNGHLATLLRDFETWYASCTGRLPPIPVSPARDRSGSPFKSGARQQGFGATAAYDWTATTSGGGDDVLDDAEAFEQMELARVTSSEPDSAAYFTATRRIRQGARPFGKRN